MSGMLTGGPGLRRSRHSAWCLGLRPVVQGPAPPAPSLSQARCPSGLLLAPVDCPCTSQSQEDYPGRLLADGGHLRGTYLSGGVGLKIHGVGSMLLPSTRYFPGSRGWTLPCSGASGGRHDTPISPVTAPFIPLPAASVPREPGLNHASPANFQLTCKLFFPA